MTDKNRIKKILTILDAEYGTEVRTYLDHNSAWQLLIATILSAQCTDARVNIVTKDLFKKYSSVKAFADADLQELEQDIHSTGFYHNKAKNIIACCRILHDKYMDKVPCDIDELTKLPGVGRKTANVIQAVAFGKAAMAVDTHIYRVSHRLGLVRKTDNNPYKVELELKRHIPEEDIPDAHHWLLLHGRYICTSLKPKCDKCPFDDICPKLLENSKLN